MKNADVNLCNNDGISPLWKACQNGHEETVQLLLKHDASVNLCNNDKVSPLWITCGYENDFCFPRLTTSVLKDLRTMHMELVWQKRHERIAQVLLYRCADVNLCNKDGTSPLFIASEKGHESIAEFLLKDGANVNLPVNIGTSPLFIACKNGYKGPVQILLNNGADVNFCDDEGISSL